MTVQITRPRLRGGIRARATLIVQEFFEKHLEALLNAATALGGNRGAKLVRDIGARLPQLELVDTRLQRQLMDLDRLLRLENVADPFSEEAACFAALDMANAWIEDVCLLTDAYGAMLRRLGDALGAEGQDNDLEDLRKRAA